MRSWERGLAPRTHFRPCRENSQAHLGATAHRCRSPPSRSPSRLFSPELGRSPVLRLETPNLPASRQRAHFRRGSHPPRVPWPGSPE